VRIGGDMLWSRKAEGRFPEMKELKQRVRDRIAPDRDLGHSDRKAD
jgi:selenoprotein W-related protein